MNANYPKFVLRNWVTEAAIRQGREEDLTTVRDCSAASPPFDEQAAFDTLAAPPPDWSSGLEIELGQLRPR